MLYSREERERMEEEHLAPYAARSARTHGRQHPEQPHAYRSDFQRDRDRIIHSKAFRRLEYKTQVFINGAGDHYRTRLTHTIEMAAVSRTLARALGVNEDLAEAIALAHDLGHTPFAHAGEEELDRLMAGHGGFDHNKQSLRCVELLEYRYPAYQGLNLTWETRAGLRKHEAAQPGTLQDGLPIGPFQFIEAQIADIADDIAYYAHDADDGLDSSLLRETELADLDLWKLAEKRARAEFGRIPDDRRVNIVIRCLLDLQVEDILHTSAALLEQARPQSPEDVMRCPGRMVNLSPGMRAHADQFRTFLYRNMYYHPRIAEANKEAVALMRGLFDYYIAHPDAMGGKARHRMETEGLWRTACDYIAGMTDCYALDECKKFGIGGMKK